MKKNYEELSTFSAKALENEFKDYLYWFDKLIDTETKFNKLAHKFEDKVERAFSNRYCLAFMFALEELDLLDDIKDGKIEESKKSLVRGLDVDFVIDHLLSLEDTDNFDLINELGDLWETYNKSWSKFNKFLSDFWKVMEKIEKLDSFDKTCKEIIEAWYDDIEKIFYSEENPTEIKLNYGFKGNDVFESLEESSIDSYVKLMVNRIVDELIGEYSSREWDALSANEKFDAIKTEFFIFEGKPKYLSEVVDLVIENMNHPFDIVFESKKAIKNKDITEGMYVKNGKDTWKVIYWNGSYKNALLQYIDKNGDKSDNYVIAESYTLEGDYQNPTITWVNGMYFDADSNVGAVNEFKAWSSGKLKKSMKKIKEGLTRDVWGHSKVDSVLDIWGFSNGKEIVSPKIMNDLFEAEGFDTNCETVIEEIQKVLKINRLDAIDGNAIHIAHNSKGNRIDLVFDISLTGKLVSYSNKKGIIKFWMYLDEQGVGEYDFGFIATVEIYIPETLLTLNESKKSARKSIKEQLFDNGEHLVMDIVDMLILDFGYDKKTVEKYFYKKYKLNDFDTLSIKDYVKIKNEIEHELGYDNII